MRINITDDGEEIVLLKSERVLLQKASAKLASIGRHTDGETSLAMSEAARHIELFLADDTVGLDESAEMTA